MPEDIRTADPRGHPVLVSDDGFVDHAAAGERLRAWVREDFGVELTSIDRVGHGADTAAEAWRGVSTAGASYAVKWSGGGTPAGLLVSAHLAEHGATGVVGPMPNRVGRLWSERGGRRLSLVPWVSDDRALNGRMTAQHWVSYGALLAQVHAIAATESLTRLLPREEHTHDQVASAVRALHNRLRLPVDESDGVGAPDGHLARALADEWRAAARLLSTLLEQADDLGRELRALQAPSVVCHGDPHLGNMLVGRGGQVWLIDWALNAW
ncbi:MAG: phosphotransferase [Pseudonocardiaceae bacterium]